MFVQMISTICITFNSQLYLVLLKQPSDIHRRIKWHEDFAGLEVTARDLCVYSFQNHGIELNCSEPDALVDIKLLTFCTDFLFLRHCQQRTIQGQQGDQDLEKLHHIIHISPFELKNDFEDKEMTPEFMDHLCRYQPTWEEFESFLVLLGYTGLRDMVAQYRQKELFQHCSFKELLELCQSDNISNLEAAFPTIENNSCLVRLRKLLCACKAGSFLFGLD